MIQFLYWYWFEPLASLPTDEWFCKNGQCWSTLNQAYHGYHSLMCFSFLTMFIALQIGNINNSCI